MPKPIEYVAETRIKVFISQQMLNDYFDSDDEYDEEYSESEVQEFLESDDERGVLVQEELDPWTVTVKHADENEDAETEGVAI